MASSRLPGSIGISSRTNSRVPSAHAGPTGKSTAPPDPHVAELRELSFDLVQLAFDLAGIVDPTPVSDGASGLLALARGRWLDAAISGVSMIPYVGDLAKAGKLPRYLKSVERAIRIAEQSADAAKILRPGIEKLRKALEFIPSGSNKHIDQMREAIDRTFRKPLASAKLKLPDIRNQFSFRSVEKDGKVYRIGEGRLGVPGKVKTHRSKSAQSGVSSGTGDDAGHLIGNRFGAPGDAQNLTKQNWKANRYGSYKQLEDQWAKKLKEGSGIEVDVIDITRKGEDRPFMRRVEWTEIAPDGSRSKTSLDFANTHTPRSRTKQNVAPTMSKPQKDNVINVDFKKGKNVD